MRVSKGDARFNVLFSKPLSKLRLLHYPYQGGQAVQHDRESAICSAHTDYGIITILWQDYVRELEVYSTQGKWIAADYVENAFLVNVARWTNDRYVSTKHRVKVINGSTVDRYSMPFFVEPNPDTVVSCFPECVSDSMPCKYSPITDHEYLMSRLNDTYENRRGNKERL